LAEIPLEILTLKNPLSEIRSNEPKNTTICRSLEWVSFLFERVNFKVFKRASPFYLPKNMICPQARLELLFKKEKKTLENKGNFR